MSLDDKLKNYAKYQFEYERADRMRKIYIKAVFIAIIADGAFCIYYFGL